MVMMHLEVLLDRHLMTGSDLGFRVEFSEYRLNRTRTYQGEQNGTEEVQHPEFFFGMVMSLKWSRSGLVFIEWVGMRDDCAQGGKVIVPVQCGVRQHPQKNGQKDHHYADCQAAKWLSCQGTYLWLRLI
jgi:hypothetical protein